MICARREHRPIGIELELRDLARSEKTIVEISGLFWNRERQRRLGLVLRKLL